MGLPPRPRRLLALGGAVCLLAGALHAEPVPAVPAVPAVSATDPAATDQPADQRAITLAREIIRIGFPEAERPAMFNRAADAMTAQMRSAVLTRFNNDPAAKAILDRALDRFMVSGKVVLNRHIPLFMEAYAQGYAHEFGAAELEQILAFVKTPLGSRYMVRSAAILSDPAFAAANKDYIRELQPLIDTMREGLTRELVDYFSKHPPKPSTSS